MCITIMSRGKRQTKSTKAKQTAAPAPAPAPTPAPEPTPQTNQVVEGPVDLSTEFASVVTKLQQLTALVSSVKTELRQLEKRANREFRAAHRQQMRRKRKTGNRKPSGFVKPTLISKELAKFLGKEEGTQMARTEVTKEINAYIRAHNLQDKSNGRKINADRKLSQLLRLKKDDELTYFNLQRYMSPHFAKAGATSV